MKILGVSLGTKNGNNDTIGAVFCPYTTHKHPRKQLPAYNQPHRLQFWKSLIPHCILRYTQPII